MLFLSCNSTRSSKDTASLGFTSVSSPWEVVYYFQPGITGQSQGSSLGTRIIGICQNTSSVLGLAAAGCCPGGCWDGAPVTVGQRDAAFPWGCCGGMQDAAELRGRHSPRRCELSPWLLSGREGNSETLFKSEVCWSLYLDVAPLLNLVFSSLIQKLFQSPCREKHGVAVGWVILGFFFSTLYERPRSVWRAGGEGR